MGTGLNPGKVIDPEFVYRLTSTAIVAPNLATDPDAIHSPESRLRVGWLCWR
jgi:hypothetical protein